jgi:hypothetical protein
VAKKVPDSENLVAYKSVPAVFVHYFGRRVPRIEEESEVRRLYDEERWVVAFGEYLDELLQNGQFGIVYIQEDTDGEKGKSVSGALLHKSGAEAKGHI